jgi:PAS domain S-box-containing protein
MLLTESEKKFKQLFNSINDALFFFDINEEGIVGKFKEVNEVACSRLGYRYDEMMNMTVFDIDIKGPCELRATTRDASGNAIERFETTHVCKSGIHIPVEINTHTFDWFGKKGIMAVARDITHRKKIEEELKGSLEKMEKLMCFLPDAVFIIKNEKIVYVNEFGVKLLGYSCEKELLGKLYIDIVHPEHRDSAENRLQYMNKENRVAPLIEKLYMKKNGQIAEVEVTGLKIPYENHSALLLVARDISERKMVKRELDEKIEFEKLRTEFFTNISHELRTPLNVLLGAIQILSLPNNCEPSPKYQRYLWTMKQNCYRLVRLVNNLIDLTKVDAGYLKADMRNYNIISIVEDITLSVADYVENRGVELIFDTDIEEKIMAFDADKIERVILNLLSNAIKFTERGDNITVNIRDLGENVEISIRDTGTGIPNEKLEVIFDRFVQVDRTLARSHEGSGIGLALVKSLVAIHGGEIRANSVYGEGSEFIVKLPVTISDKEEIEDKYLYENNIERIRIEFSDIYAY